MSETRRARPRAGAHARASRSSPTPTPLRRASLRRASRRGPQAATGSARAAAAAASRGFPPIARADARVLVLGSLPGQASLAANQYYAQPQNAFWKIMGALLGFAPELEYAQRARRLQAARIALWDVCAAAVRPGSLDSAIERRSIEVNDFAAFLAAHPRIERICFNGATAEHLFERRVLPALPPRARGLQRLRLPSTSPAHAGMRPAVKLERWSVVVQHLRQRKNI